MPVTYDQDKQHASHGSQIIANIHYTFVEHVVGNTVSIAKATATATTTTPTNITFYIGGLISFNNNFVV